MINIGSASMTLCQSADSHTFYGFNIPRRRQRRPRQCAAMYLGSWYS
jgi:hypothetical protein